MISVSFLHNRQYIEPLMHTDALTFLCCMQAKKKLAQRKVCDACIVPTVVMGKFRAKTMSKCKF